MKVIGETIEYTQRETELTDQKIIFSTDELGVSNRTVLL